MSDSLAPVIVAVSEDGKTVKMSRGSWGMTCPAADLPNWLVLYRKLVRRREPNVPIYSPWVEAIEAAMRSGGLPVLPEQPEKKTRTR